MKAHGWFLCFFLFLVSPGICAGNSFKNLWYDGNAEISVYDLVENRYGEEREGKRVMVFVTEPMRLSSHIKPDVKLSGGEKVDVIKLNDIRKFTTGIYDYSIMTSVFSSVDDKSPYPPGTAMKVSFTAQEWCGHVFEIIKRKNKQYQGRLFSYFEKDGEPVYSFDTKELVHPEENLWILVRELMTTGIRFEKNNSLKLIPSSWNRRKKHIPAEVINGRLSRAEGGKVKTRMGRFKSTLFTWSYPGVITKVWVEKRYPHRILKWEESDGTRGILAASSREPYWNQHGNSHKKIRRKLTLDENR